MRKSRYCEYLIRVWTVTRNRYRHTLTRCACNSGRILNVSASVRWTFSTLRQWAA